MHGRFLITGTGRCGTGYTARLLTALGYPCGHEAAFSPSTLLTGTHLDRFRQLGADSSWLAAPFIGELPAETVVLHQLRDPLAVVRSLMGIGFMGSEHRATSPYTAVARAFCRSPEDELQANIQFVIAWNAHIERAIAERPSLVYRVEALDASTVRDIVSLVDPHRQVGEHVIQDALAAVPTTTNSRHRAGGLSWDDLGEGTLVEELRGLARRYGYQVDTAEAA